MMQTSWKRKCRTMQVEEFEEAQHQRGRIQDEMAGIKQVLEQIRSVQRPKRGT
jgi:hypothetical protein